MTLKGIKYQERWRQISKDPTIQILLTISVTWYSTNTHATVEIAKKISEEIRVKINKIVIDIKLSKLFRFVPLTIKDQSENILANFEQFHIRDITLRDFMMTTEK